MIDAVGWLSLLLQIFFVDLILGADNAVVIALACRRLPAKDAPRAVFLGAAGAVALRLVMILFADSLLGVPLVKLIGAWMLVGIALNIKGRKAEDADAAYHSAGRAADIVSAAAVIALADAAMSLDNVVALAAIANGNFLLLASGVLLSIPILAFGAVILSEIVRRAPEIVAIGAAVLGWIAGGMAVTDPLVAGWVQTQAPTLAIVAPPLLALFALIAEPGAKRRKLSAKIGPKTAARTAPPGAHAPQHSAASPRAEPNSPATIPQEDQPPAFAPESLANAARGWTEERIVVAGFVLLAFLAGLIILIASFFDSLT